jgi:prolipoprotein diacylglyceryltransferase
LVLIIVYLLNKLHYIKVWKILSYELEMLRPLFFLNHLWDWYYLIMVPTVLIASIFFFFFNRSIIPAKNRLTTTECLIFLYTILIVGYFGSKAISVLEDFFISDYSFSQFGFINDFFHGVGHRWYGNLFTVVILLLSSLIIYSKDKLFTIYDIFSISACLGVALGKWGCFFSGHYGCYGQPTSLPWGVTFPYGSAPPTCPVHPIQVYDSIFHLLLFTTLLFFFTIKKPNPGTIAGIFFICTATYNILMEFISTNMPVFWIIDFEQIIYFMILIIGVFLLSFRSTNKEIIITP